MCANETHGPRAIQQGNGQQRSRPHAIFEDESRHGSTRHPGGRLASFQDRCKPPVRPTGRNHNGGSVVPFCRRPVYRQGRSLLRPVARCEGRTPRPDSKLLIVLIIGSRISCPIGLGPRCRRTGSRPDCKRRANGQQSLSSVHDELALTERQFVRQIILERARDRNEEPARKSAKPPPGAVLILANSSGVGSVAILLRRRRGPIQRAFPCVNRSARHRINPTGRARTQDARS